MNIRSLTIRLTLLCVTVVFSFGACSKSKKGALLGGDCNNEAVTHDIPFSYTLESDHLKLASGIKLSLGPWGAHVMPYTGHPIGNAKADFQGLYAWTLSELTELTPSNGNGTCETGETCGVPEAHLLAKAPEYISPSNGMLVTSVKIYSVHPEGNYYSSPLQWEVQTQICQFGITFGHVRKISPVLRAKMMGAGYADPWTVTSTSSGNLITGPSITLNKGDSVALPQIVAEPIAGHAGYFTGKWSNTSTPWAQIEFGTRRNNQSQAIYRWLPGPLRETMRNILIADISNPNSMRYSGYSNMAVWLWKAEADLWTAPQSFMDEYGSLFTNLGGWQETSDTGGCTTGETKCDRIFSIFPILGGSPLYDASLYASPTSSYLVYERDRAAQSDHWGEVISPSQVDPLVGYLKIRWREYISGNTINYQGVRYNLDREGKMLRIRWGAKVPAADQIALPPDVSNSETCNGTTLTCHNHDYRGD